MSQNPDPAPSPEVRDLYEKKPVQLPPMPGTGPLDTAQEIQPFRLFKPGLITEDQQDYDFRPIPVVEEEPVPKDLSAPVSAESSPPSEETAGTSASPEKTAPVASPTPPAASPKAAAKASGQPRGSASSTPPS